MATSFSGLRQGSTGNTVAQLQTVLQALGFDLGPDGVDGKFGSYTANAVKSFQKANNLQVDGIVGPQTDAALQRSAAMLPLAANPQPLPGSASPGASGSTTTTIHDTTPTGPAPDQSQMTTGVAGKFAKYAPWAVVIGLGWYFLRSPASSSRPSLGGLRRRRAQR